MKKLGFALILILALALPVLPAASAEEAPATPNNVVPAEQPGSQSGSSGAGDIGAVPPGPVVPGGQTDQQSGGAGAGDIGAGAASSPYQGSAAAPQNPVTRFFGALASWVRMRAAPWVSTVFLPWIELNWRKVAIACAGLIVLRVVLGAFSRRRQHSRAGK